MIHAPAGVGRSTRPATVEAGEAGMGDGGGDGDGSEAEVPDRLVSQPLPLPDRLVLFDGVCNLCNASVDFLIRRDRQRRLRYASLQSEVGERVLREMGAGEGRSSAAPVAPAAAPVAPAAAPVAPAAAPVAPAAAPVAARFSSVLFVEEGRIHTRSTAALRLSLHLGLGWRLLARVGLVVPRPLRDAAYDLVARNRYRWWGRRESCRVPTPEERALFVE